MELAPGGQTNSRKSCCCTFLPSRMWEETVTAPATLHSLCSHWLGPVANSALTLKAYLSLYGVLTPFHPPSLIAQLSFSTVETKRPVSIMKPSHLRMVCVSYSFVSLSQLANIALLQGSKNRRKSGLSRLLSTRFSNTVWLHNLSIAARAPVSAPLVVIYTKKEADSWHFQI